MASFDPEAGWAEPSDMRLNRLLIVALAAGAAAGCSRTSSNNQAAPAAAGADRKYLLERVDDAAVVQLYADGFDALPLREKTLIWHLSRAALAGRDIFIDQKHRDALEMRGVIDQIVAHPQGIDAATLVEIQRYAKLFWINNGPYNNLTARKFVLTLQPAALVAAAKAATQAGGRIETRPGESLEAKLTRLQPMFFDPNVDAIVTNKTPPAGKDILEASANNLYVNVKMADLEGFTETHGLNSRLVKQPDGTLTEEVYTIDGRYSAQLTGGCPVRC